MTGRAARFITHSPPAPGISGDRIRVFHLMRELKRRGWSVRLWSLLAPDEPAGFGEALRAVADEVVLVPRSQSRQVRLARLARDVITSRAFQAHWFWSPASARAAAAWLSDVSDEPLFVEQLYMYPFVPDHLKHLVALDTQNHEAARMAAIARGEGGLGRRAVARLQIGAVRAYETAALASVGRVIAVSDAESAAFEPLAPGRVRTVPNGVDVEAITVVSTAPASSDLLFLGSLGYSANLDALRHFAADIAPHLAGSAARLTVVGSNPDRAVYELARRASSVPVIVAGFVPDLAPHFRSSRAMVVPLRHGGGTRLKILEALAWGLPVVTTSVGGAGLNLTNGQDALIADDPASFATAVARLLRDDELWTGLSRNGRALVEARYGWPGIGARFDAVMREVGDRSPVPGH